MDTMPIVIGLAVVIIVVAFVALRKKPADAGKTQDDAPQTEEIKGDQELYALGLNPVSDKLIMYALETCQHCKNTRKFLDEHNVEYTIIFLDQYVGKQRSDLMEKVRSYNPRGTFPTMIVPGGKVVIGYRKQLLQEALNI